MKDVVGFVSGQSESAVSVSLVHRFRLGSASVPRWRRSITLPSWASTHIAIASAHQRLTCRSSQRTSALALVRYRSSPHDAMAMYSETTSARETSFLSGSTNRILLYADESATGLSYERCPSVPPRRMPQEPIPGSCRTAAAYPRRVPPSCPLAIPFDSPARGRNVHRPPYCCLLPVVTLRVLTAAGLLPEYFQRGPASRNLSSLCISCCSSSRTAHR